MPQKQTICITPKNGLTLKDQLIDCHSALQKELEINRLKYSDILKQTIFIKAHDNADYYKKKKETLHGLNQFHSSPLPPTSIVGQPPENGALLSIELLVLAGSKEDLEISRKQSNGIDYIILKDKTGSTTDNSKYNEYKEIIAAGIASSETIGEIRPQSEEAFRRMKEILDIEGMNFSQVVRQWNFIEGITQSLADNDGCKQNYQVFNDIRSIYYQSASFGNGYPAATGIGMNTGGVVLEFIAVQPAATSSATSTVTAPAIIAIKNPGQVDAHQYSQQVLVGNAVKGLPQKTTPKFERAKAVVNVDSSSNCESFYVYISGTAAIEGQKTMFPTDVEEQTHVTMKNILRLISPENLEQHGVCKSDDTLSYSNFRIYVKNEADIPAVRATCHQYFDTHTVPCLFVVSDICRDALLVEIEGAAHSDF